MREGFLLYKSFYEPIKALSKTDKGELLEAIFEYQISKTEPKTISKIYPYFLFFKNQFRLDDVKYNVIVERNKLNGIKGGRPLKPNKPNGLLKTQPNPMEASEPKKADKDKEKDKEKDNEKENVFEKFRVKFPGVKKGLETEFTNFQKKHKDWLEVLPTLETKLDGQIAWRKNATGFVPEWQHLQTWINQRSWEAEMENNQNGKAIVSALDPRRKYNAFGD